MTLKEPTRESRSESGGGATGPLAILRMAAGRLAILLRSEGTAGSLARGSLSVVLVSTGGMAAGFALQLVLTRTLGPEQYGLYAYVIGWLNAAILVAKIDLDTGAIRFVGSYAGANDWSRIRGYVEGMGAVVLLGALVLGGMAGAGLWLGRSMMDEAVFMAFLVACAVLPAATALRMLAGVAHGLGRVVQAQLPEKVIRPALTGVLVLVGILGLGFARSAAVALGASFAASLGSIAVGFVLLRRVLPGAYREPAPVRETRLWLRTGLGLFVISLLQLVLSTGTDVIVVGTLLEPVEAGRYSIASLVASLCMLAFGAVMFTATPMIADFHRNRSHAELQRLLTSVSRVGLALTLPSVAVIGLLGRPILAIFGPSFVEGYPILVVSLVTSLQHAAVGSLAGFVLTMTGREVPAAWIIAAGSAVYLVVVYPLTIAYGAVGTAVATLVAFLVRSVLLTWYIRSRLRLNVLPV